MKENFKKLPDPLKRQIICRMTAGGIFLPVFILMLIFTHDFILSLPCLILSVILIISSTFMLFNCLAKKYVILRGVCTEIEKTVFRKRIKSFCISTDKEIWKIVVPRKLKGLAVGKDITLYLPSKTQVYEENGTMLVFSCYAHDINSTKTV